MSSLREFQASLAAYLLAAPGTLAPAALIAAARDTPGAAARLGIYKNNVYVRLIEALEASFPVVKRLVGGEFFRFAARTYIPRDPPGAGTLLDYGARLAEFLQGFPPAASVPYLADIARLEWLCLNAYHAPDIPSLRGDMLTELLASDEDPRLRLHPSAGLMISPHPVSRIWELNLRESNVEETSFPAESECLLVIRPNARVEVHRLSPGAYALVSAIAAGRDLASAFAAARAAENGFDPRRGLSALLHAGTFAANETRPKS